MALQESLDAAAQLDVRAASSGDKRIPGRRFTTDGLGENLFDDGPALRRHGSPRGYAG